MIAANKFRIKLFHSLKDKIHQNEVIHSVASNVNEIDILNQTAQISLLSQKIREIV